MRDLTLNQQEQTRIQVLNSVLEYQLPIAQAAEIMGLSQRHTKRLLAAYRRDGPAALAHGNRDRRPHNAVPEAAVAAVVKLANNTYAGANHTHFTELLRDREGIDLSRPTVRRILAKAGMGSPRSRRSSQHRFRRRRMPQEGMLVQIDGSHHPWLEGAGGPSGLSHRGGHSGLSGAAGGSGPAVGNPPGPLQRPPRGFQIQCPSGAGACRVHPVRQGDAGVGHQADLRPLPPRPREGWSGWGQTLQDRLVTELRLAGAATIQEANDVLQQFLPRFNAQFAVAAEQPEKAYRPVSAELSLTETICLKHPRKVGRDNTVKYHWRVSRAERNQAVWRSKSVPLERRCSAKMSAYDGCRREPLVAARLVEPMRQGNRWLSAW